MSCLHAVAGGTKSAMPPLSSVAVTLDRFCRSDTHLGTARSAACLQSLLTVAQAATALRPGRKVKTVTSRFRGRVPAEGK